MYTTRDIASILGLHVRMVQVHIKQGHLKAEKKGRDYLIEEIELERFRHERRARGRPRIFAEWQKMKELAAAGLYDPKTDTHGFPPVPQEKREE